MKIKMWRVKLENDTDVYLCPQHLKQWKDDGGDEKAELAPELDVEDCDYCRAARSDWER
jgi:hypothetical protein